MWLKDVVNTLGRMVVSLLIWGGAIGISIAAAQDQSGLAALLMVVLVWFMALAGTFVMWVMPEMMHHDHAVLPLTQPVAEKAKRRSRREEQMELLAELMDDDERAAFKERLKQRILEETDYADGELPEYGTSLAALLDEESPKRARR